MIIRNVQIFSENRTFTQGDIIVYNGKFAETSLQNEEIIDGHGWYAIPGLIDIHFHGCAGYDFCDGTEEALEKMSAYEASVGVTGICPASMTIEESQLYQAMKNAGEYTCHGGAKLEGIHMEGPFISEKKKGAQAAENIRTCDLELYQRLQEASGGQIRIVDIAPETVGA
ncbi:MAG: N-acetylglucosamine-6-phosphate deacetylase, partial [Clostridia bacterium]|nr:N-acetylglucosamine-6-phosphate deacetylase [Clostridia bacterium]